MNQVHTEGNFSKRSKEPVSENVFSRIMIASKNRAETAHENSNQEEHSEYAMKYLFSELYKACARVDHSCAPLWYGIMIQMTASTIIIPKT